MYIQVFLYINSSLIFHVTEPKCFTSAIFFQYLFYFLQDP